MHTKTATPATGIKLWETDNLEVRLCDNRFRVYTTSAMVADLSPTQAYDLMKALKFGLEEWGRV